MKGLNDFEPSCHVLQFSVSVAIDEFQKNMLHVSFFTVTVLCGLGSNEINKMHSSIRIAA